MNLRNRKPKKMRGVWYHWIMATVILFVMILFFQILTYPINLLVDTFDETDFNTSGVNSSWHVTTTRIETSWNWWPVVGGVILILIIFFISTREEYDTGYMERGGF